jgi:glutamate-ammonia-ligase adenylyltransferase
MDAFAEYQRERAWVWEHQALVRARSIAGDPSLRARFDDTRREVLCRTRDRAVLFDEIRSMRERWRAQFDRSTPSSFDLKQGPGGLVDIEFLTQALALADARQCGALVDTTRTPALIEAAIACGALSADAGQALSRAHETLLRAALSCTLDSAPRLVPRNAELDRVTAEVLQACERAGLFPPQTARP